MSNVLYNNFEFQKSKNNSKILTANLALKILKNKHNILQKKVKVKKTLPENDKKVINNKSDMYLENTLTHDSHLFIDKKFIKFG